MREWEKKNLISVVFVKKKERNKKVSLKAVYNFPLEQNKTPFCINKADMINEKRKINCERNIGIGVLHRLN